VLQGDLKILSTVSWCSVHKTGSLGDGNMSGGKQRQSPITPCWTEVGTAIECRTSVDSIHRNIYISKNHSVNLMPRWPLFWGEINSRTSQGLSSTLMTFFQTYSTAVFSTWHSFYVIKSVSNTDVQNTACLEFSNDGTIFHITGIFDHFGIEALSRTSYAKFQNFQAPNPFSRTFQGLEKWEKIQVFSRTFNKVATL